MSEAQDSDGGPSIEELTERPDYAVWEGTEVAVYTHGGKGKVMIEVEDGVSFEVNADRSEVGQLLRDHADNADRIRGDD